MANPNEYSLQETVDGQTVTYDAQGNVVSKNFTATPKPVSTLQFRRKGENALHIRQVNTHAHPHVLIQVANGAACNYFINTSASPNTWTRTGACPSPSSGLITELEIRDDVAGDPWQTVQWVVDQSAEIVLQATGSTCTYRFNKVLQRWERICTG
jgi:hypothetical protein